MAMLHMANDSGLFRSREDLEAAGARLEGNVFVRDGERWLPLYEAKMIHQFDHRFGTYEGQTQAQANQGKLPEFDDAQHADPNLLVLPRYWVAESEVDLPARGPLEPRLAPGLAGHLQDQRRPDRHLRRRTPHRRWGQAPANASGAPQAFVLPGLLDSFVVDFVARQKLGGTSLKYYTVCASFPCLPQLRSAGPVRGVQGPR